MQSNQDENPKSAGSAENKLDPKEQITTSRGQIQEWINTSVELALKQQADEYAKMAHLSNNTANTPSVEMKGNLASGTSELLPSSISHVAVKTPQPLYNQNPVVWFTILEQQFKLANVTAEDTKYSHAVSALDSRLHNQFAAIIIQDKGNKPYTIFKDHVIKVLGESERSKLNNVLHGLSLGDQKPSQLLSQLKMSAGDQVDQNFLKQLWMKRLPQQIQLILTPLEKNLNMTQLAESADALMETMALQIHAVATPNAHATPSSRVEQIMDDKLERMRKEISEISELIRKNSTHQSRSKSPQSTSSKRPNRERSTSRNAQSSKDKCYYHNKFGDKAQKCTTGCILHKSFLENQKAMENATNPKN